MSFFHQVLMFITVYIGIAFGLSLLILVGHYFSNRDELEQHSNGEDDISSRTSEEVERLVTANLWKAHVIRGPHKPRVRKYDES